MLVEYFNGELGGHIHWQKPHCRILNFYSFVESALGSRIFINSIILMLGNTFYLFDHRAPISHNGEKPGTIICKIEQEHYAENRFVIKYYFGLQYLYLKGV